MRLLITGAAGQLGQEWEQFCRRNDIDYISYNSSVLDITDSSKVREVLTQTAPDVVINCAAYTRVDQAESEPGLANLINHLAVANLAEICKELDIKLVHYSTDYVFPGRQEDKEEMPDGYFEDSVTAPINVYGKSKLDGEQAITKSGCTHLILRVSWLCGKHGSNFVKTMLKLAAEKDSLNVVNDQYGSPTFTKNVVEWTNALLRKKAQGIVHLSSAGQATWCDFAKEIFNIAGLQITINPVDSYAFRREAKRPSFSKLNTSKMVSILGIKPDKWQVGLKELIEEISQK